jgi:hypothetical protein
VIVPCTCSACACRVCGARCTEDCVGHDYDPGPPRGPRDTLPCAPPVHMLGPDAFPEDAPPDSLRFVTSGAVS